MSFIMSYLIACLVILGSPLVVFLFILVDYEERQSSLSKETEQ